MKKLNWIILLSLLTCFFTSCDDDDDDPSNTELISMSWKVDDYSIIDGIESEDRSTYTFTFNSDGTYTFNTPTAITGTWQFQSSSNESVIVLDGSENVDVLTLTTSDLVLEFDSPTFKNPDRIIHYELIPN